MSNDFLLVSKAVLPDYFPKIVKAKDLIAASNISVTEACKTLGISRSVFYKYKDAIYIPSGSLAKKAIISIKADDFPGVLSSILITISKNQGNVLTISQDMPIHGLAYITMMINTRNMVVGLTDLVKELSSLPHLRKADVLAYD
ncbi:MAG: ACT domain-containing protein [Bacilli bacterium]|jgi:chorismate mutase|nr:ACT domain-containing protein [Bacilli bacterium]